MKHSPIQFRLCMFQAIKLVDVGNLCLHSVVKGE